MSHNLHLGDRQAQFQLYQTPTEITERALAGITRDVYFAWLDSLVERIKPTLHPRASNAERRRIRSTPAWREHERYAAQIQAHKTDLDRFLVEHPQARWGES